jgi:hypothetical protein
MARGDADAVEQVSDTVAGPRGECETGGDATDGQRRAFAKDERADVRPSRAERQAHANLASSSADSECHRRIQAAARQHQRHERQC